MKSSGQQDLSTTQEFSTAELTKVYEAHVKRDLEKKLQESNARVKELEIRAEATSKKEYKPWISTRHRVALVTAITAIVAFNVVMERLESGDRETQRVTVSTQNEGGGTRFIEPARAAEPENKRPEIGLGDWGKGWPKPKGLDPRTVPTGRR